MSQATKQYNDYELLYMIEDESKEALEILIKKYEPLIYTRLVKFKIRKEYFEDYFQEGLFVLFNAIKKYNCDSPMSFTNFFDLLLKRRIMDLLRKNKRYFEDISLYEDIDIVATYEPNNIDLDIVKIKELFNALSNLEKKVFILKYKENKKAEEISNALKINLKSVYSASDRIKNKATRLK